VSFWKGEARAEKIHFLRGLDFDRRGRGRKGQCEPHFTENMHTKEQHNNMTLQTWRTQNFQGVNRYKPQHMKRIKEAPHCEAKLEAKSTKEYILSNLDNALSGRPNRDASVLEHLLDASTLKDPRESEVNHFRSVFEET
jgi:hypothetical protein